MIARHLAPPPPPFGDWQFCCPSQRWIDIWTYGNIRAELLDSIQADDLNMSVEDDIPERGLAQQSLGASTCESILEG